MRNPFERARQWYYNIVESSTRHIRWRSRVPLGAAAAGREDGREPVVGSPVDGAGAAGTFCFRPRDLVVVDCYSAADDGCAVAQQRPSVRRVVRTTVLFFLFFYYSIILLFNSRTVYDNTIIVVLGRRPGEIIPQ